MFGKLSSKLRGSGSSKKKQEEEEEVADDAVASNAPPRLNESSSTSRHGLYDFGRSYTFPNLYQEADELLLVALLTYTITDLRSMAKQEKLPAKILELPLSLEMCLSVIEDNLETIKQEEQGHELALSALKSIQARYEPTGAAVGQDNNAATTANNNTHWLNPFARRSKNKTTNGPTENTQHQPTAVLTAFGDQNPDKELVYGIGVDHYRKRVTVAFRGSVTQTDFITDACIELHRRTTHSDVTIGIHHGFDEYLLKRRRKGVGKSKYDEILEHVEMQFKKHSDYRLYVTGHSLGGALACLFSFEVAAEPSKLIPTPVTCVSVASPRVGDSNFQTAFVQLEQAGKLRHLRIAHAQDPVPMMPKTSSKKLLSMLSPVLYATLAATDRLRSDSETYRHTGVKLRLNSDSSKNNSSSSNNKYYQLSYQGVTTVEEEIADDDNDTETKQRPGLLSSVKKRLSLSHVPGVKFHYGTAYTEQLQKCGDDLRRVFLNDLYSQMGTKTATKTSA